MKIRLSYFYQIRNFKKNMVPMSTAKWDPAWFHGFQDSDYIFYDKRGILNGLRLKSIIVQDDECECPCGKKNGEYCHTMQHYRKKLETINFNKMMKGIEEFAKRYKMEHHIEDEIVMVLIVYETPDNPCSERKSLLDYFNSHGVECKELEYPII